MSTEQINTALRVEARFAARVGEADRTSIFWLARNPDVAAWLRTILDHVLAARGALPGEHPIGPPPGGETLDRLIEGGVLLADRRPDGGLALALNPALSLFLWLSVRVRDEPARTAEVALGDEPDLARWLLDAHLVPPDGQLTAPLAGPLADALRHLGILTPVLPPPEAWFPDPFPAEGGPGNGGSAAGGPATDLATAVALLPQPAGTGVPPAVRAVLGRQTPRLPPGQAVTWLVDAGSGLALPVAGLVDAPVPGPAAAARASDFEQGVAAAATSLRDRRYAVLRGILPPGARAQLRRYARELRRRGYYPALGDGQVERRAGLHNEPTLAALHQGLANLLGRVSGSPVLPTYCYLGCYEQGAVLERHRDRPQCQWNLSLVIDMENLAGGDDPPPWPIWLELDGEPEAVLLAPGDGLAYSGTELWHWRDPLPAGQRATVCFFHFVPPDFAGSRD